MSLFNTSSKAYLMLANGRVFEGYSFGANGTAYGEIVFTTSMVGYQETLTDPAYHGRIITQTFPLIGNYGVNGEDNESEKVSANGYIVREWCNTPSNFRSEGDIDGFLKKHGLIGIHSVDTRSITRIIRDNGTMNCVITTDNIYEKKEELLKTLQEYKTEDSVKNTTVKEKQVFNADGSKYEIALLDLGYKYSIRDELISRGCNVTVYPAFTSAEEIIAAKPDGIVYSNGTGNPADYPEIVKTIQTVNEKKIPSFGIDMGHNLMALAAGAEPEKLKYGHRGANQPALNVKSGKTFVTSQNHAYAVSNESVNNDKAEITYINVNDKTCEGLSYKGIPAFSVQFIPEYSGGPQNTALLYDEFIDMIKENR